jgi:hypothetical protein
MRHGQIAARLVRQAAQLIQPADVLQLVVEAQGHDVAPVGGPLAAGADEEAALLAIALDPLGSPSDVVLSDSDTLYANLMSGLGHALQGEMAISRTDGCVDVEVQRHSVR